MAGYTRQSSFADGDTITAALFNDEYNQLVNAFHNSTGHSHDGTAASGPVIGLIGDAGETSPNNKVLIDTTNNYIEFYVEVSSAPVQQLYIADGAIIPVTDSDVDLGTTSLRFKNTYTDTVTTTGNVSVGGNLTVTGNATISGNLTFGDADTDSINLAAEIDSDIIPNTDGTYDLGSATKEWQDLYIDGTANIDSLVADTADINGGTIDGSTIATSDITVGSGKTLNVSAGTLTLADNQISGDKVEGGTIAATTITTLASTTGNITNVNATTVDTTNIEVTNIKAKDGTAAGSIADSTGVVTLASSVLTTTDINGGTIDGTTIATSDITVGAGKTLDVSAGTLTLADNQISGDKVEGGTIAATTITDLTFGSLNDGTITVTAFVDEDDMTSDSATLVPTQQSVKAYVDSQVTAQDLDFQGDTGGALSIDLDSETLTIAGGTGLDTVGSGNTVTVNIDSTVATLTGTQTLTNKTLTSPVINTGVSGTAVLDDDTFATASATTLATSESIKAYVDTRILTEDTLAELNDTNITSPADGSLLFYDTGTSMWIDNVVSGDITIADTGVATIAAGAVDNAMLAGSIANDKLANSTVSFGGISLALGASDATPAFDLTDATNYPTSSLTGTITNAQLAGSIEVSKTLLTAGTGLTLSTNTLSVDAAQTQITSVGTLGSLTVSGDLTIDTSTLVVDSTNNRVGILDATPAVSLDAGSATDAIFVPKGTTAQRPSGVDGYFRYNTDDAQFEGYADGAWGAIAGSGGGGSAIEPQIFAGDGSTVNFTLTSAPTSENNLLVFIDGAFQAQNTYSVSGTTLTFSTAPANTRVVTVYHARSSISGSNMIVDTMTGDNSDTTLTLSVAPVSENNVQVYFDGVYQSKTNYSISGTTLTFSTAPASGVAVEAITHTQTSVNVPTSNSVGITQLNVSDGSNGQALTTNGSGTLSFATVGVSGISSSADATAITIDSSENTSLLGDLILNTAGADVSADDVFGRIDFYDQDGGSGAAGTTSRIESVAVGAVGASKLTFSTSTSGGGARSSLTEKMVIDESGNVGIGNASPQVNFVVGDGTNGTGLEVTPNESSGYVNMNAYDRGSSAWRTMNIGGDVVTLNTGGTEHIRINSAGRLLSGLTSPIEIERLGIQFNGGNSVGISLKTTASDGYLQRFFDSGGTNQGNIYLATNGTVSFNNLSDYRVKENVVTDWDATTRLKQLKPSRFNFIADSTNTTVDGFLAHEVENIVPEAITGTKDATEELTNVVINNVGNVIARDIEEEDWIAGKEDETYPSDSTWEATHTANVYQGIDQAKLVPLLVKTIQELEERITTLENA